MSEEQKVNETSGEFNQPAPNASSEGKANQPSNDADSVAYETHRKLLRQRKADQQRMEELQERLEKYEEAEKAKQQQQLEAKGEYEKILKVKEQEIQELRNQQAEIARRNVEAAKYQAFMDALPGKLRNKSYLAHVNIEDIVVDPDSNTVDDYSVKKAVDNFLSEHSSLIEPKEKPKATIPSSSPRSVVTDEKMSNDDKLKLLLQKKG